MMRSREIILQMLHDPRYCITDVVVWYIDRGAPGDTSKVIGKDILSAGSLALDVATPAGTKNIPYHRIVRIVHQGEVLWDTSCRRGDPPGHSG